MKKKKEKCVYLWPVCTKFRAFDIRNLEIQKDWYVNLKPVPYKVEFLMLSDSKKNYPLNQAHSKFSKNGMVF